MVGVVSTVLGSREVAGGRAGEVLRCPPSVVEHVLTPTELSVGTHVQTVFESGVGTFQHSYRVVLARSVQTVFKR
jgi:hypothetical protein